MNPPPVIEVRGLTRSFRTYRKKPGLLGAVKGLFHREYQQTTAVNQVSFSIKEGEFVGFLGANGAGKTTTLKMLAGLLHPTAGTASVLGFTPWERPIEYRQQFALLLGQKNQLWWDLPARESLELNGRIYGIARPDVIRRIRDLTALLRVDEKLDVMVRELSLGERMKFELIAALLHQPKVLFLDEPTIGLDVVSQRTVREFLRTYNREHRTTVLLTSHYMSDIEALCRRVIIIDEGRVFFDGALSDVLDQFTRSKLVTVELDERLARPDLAALNLTDLGKVVEQTGTLLRIKVSRDRLVPVCKTLLQRLPVVDLGIDEMPAEEVIHQIFAGSDGLPRSETNFWATKAAA